MRAGAVTWDSFAHRTLWSWTTREQAELLRAKKRLLIEGEMPEGPTAYVQRLTLLAAGRTPAAQLARVLLAHPNLALRRYAWSRPWSTRLGLGARDYGDQLVGVRLRPEAVIGRFDPTGKQPFHFVDLDGRPVPLGRLLGDPSTIGAIVHVRMDGELPYREYVLCNESMIESWTVGGQTIERAISEDARMLEGLAATPPALSGASLQAAWSGEPSDSAGAAYAASLAFASPKYVPSAEHLSAIARALRSSPQVGAPLTVKPNVSFSPEMPAPLAAIRRPPPPIHIVDV